ncbi:hypothetical protein [Pediococcus claussenii]|uniref:Uncharacterized protein n=1 Tax=Pediococcus claussenii (strain ATCC BAA-344 / DSM 14800 / JCM 18046 / KCTC 3811 / LMG 21948 / P06) TaxID=701521 RepID=G8PEE9_PEDCP|nr:hypothetical protein [Pediococcus claussenii]AEV94410.1 hypothetical protein PECL_82 [Pediococcus claussenii ATCC BAA-344]ANZ69631.1 hypothetical protein AYR57_04575 [Pediococcus claussenii]ANZ71448.1 hypothetical protein AYR58_04580 [Pediococcus claussenii]KRN19886.1 hypothetical protein IV79_GL001175 [Pediococcus claussenii]
MPQTDAQKRAQKKYNEKNKEKRKVMSYRNSARTFIRSYANDEDLLEFSGLIQERYRINKLLRRLDGVRSYINNPNFLNKNHLNIKIWRRSVDLLNDRLENGKSTTDWDSWFKKNIEPKFSKEEPVVEIIHKNKSRFYNGNRAYDILDWLD